MPSPKTQLMKPETAAKKLGIYLPAAPDGFRDSAVSRADLDRMLSELPEWLEQLRREGPHPRPIVAGKLGISISGLARGGADEPLTTAEITAMLKAPPPWLVQERAVQAEVRAEKIRVAERDAERRARRTDS